MISINGVGAQKLRHDQEPDGRDQWRLQWQIIYRRNELQSSAATFDVSGNATNQITRASGLGSLSLGMNLNWPPTRRK